MYRSIASTKTEKEEIKLHLNDLTFVVDDLFSVYSSGAFDVVLLTRDVAISNYLGAVDDDVHSKMLLSHVSIHEKKDEQNDVVSWVGYGMVAPPFPIQ